MVSILILAKKFRIKSPKFIITKEIKFKLKPFIYKQRKREKKKKEKMNRNFYVLIILFQNCAVRANYKKHIDLIFLKEKKSSDSIILECTTDSNLATGLRDRNIFY